jgi:hypothetical protein
MTTDFSHRQLVSGLDGLPLTSVPKVPLPDDHPDHDTFTADMAAIARAARWLWIHALHGHPKPAMPDDDLLCDFIPGCEVELFLKVDMATFDLIPHDIQTAFDRVRGAVTVAISELAVA